MNKNKLIKYAGLVGAMAVVAIAVVWLVMPKLAPGTKSFPKKDPDISPTLPVPKNAASAVNAANVEIVFVPRVIDGDTIVVEPVNATTGKPGKQETVRYVGMDTPETVSPTKPVECYGHEASVRDKALVDGKYVAMVRDVSDKDKYGRLLRFVYLLNGASSTAARGAASLGTMVDLELVKEGYARVLTIPPDTEFEANFKAAASAAQSAKLGFWGACATYPFE